MRQLAGEGTTMIRVTRDMGFARDASDRVTYAHQGIIEEIDTPAGIFEHPTSEKLQQLLRGTR